jgi:hypothetical protein
MMHAYDPEYVPPGVQGAQLEDLSRKLKKSVPRRARDELGPLLLEMRGASAAERAQLQAGADQFANRFALVALGSFPAALSAVLKTLTGQVPGADQGPARLELMRQVTDAWDLLTFALSDAHLLARQHAGMEGR